MSEAVIHDHHTSTGLDSWKIGFWTFIGSECLFFASLISTYMVYKGKSLAGPYPEEILNIHLMKEVFVSRAKKFQNFCILRSVSRHR